MLLNLEAVPSLEADQTKWSAWLACILRPVPLESACRIQGGVSNFCIVYMSCAAASRLGSHGLKADSNTGQQRMACIQCRRLESDAGSGRSARTELERFKLD